MEPMLNNFEETVFLLSHLRPDMTCIEFGSGGSTLEIAKHVKELVTFEHDPIWYDRIKPLLPSNATIYLVPKNKEEKSGDDGTEDDYFDYVHAHEKLGKKWDLCFVDGRARPHCARSILPYLNDGAVILIHDIFHPQPEYRRYDLEVVEEFLERIDGVFALHSFKPR